MNFSDRLRIWKEQLFLLLKDPKKAPVLLMVLGLSGIVLIFLSSLQKDASPQKQSSDDGVVNYNKLLQQELEEFVSKIDGAGESKVMVSFYDYGERFYLKEQSQTEGGSKESFVITDGENGKEAVEISDRPPEIRGVAVLCQGGDDQNICLAVTEAVSTALGISSHRVYVSKIAP